MLVTGYYDEPNSGFLRCEACSSVYFFTTLSRPTEEALDRIEAFLETIISQAGSTILLMAWEKFSNKVLAVRKVTGLPTPSDLNMFAPRSLEAKSAADWFDDLGMTLSDG